jgi:DNA polymerase (family 10)
MPQVNKEIAHIFSSMADLLEIRGRRDDFYRVQAYRSASLTIASEGQDVLAMEEKELRKMSGIGEAIAEKIIEYRETGTVAGHEKLKKSLPSGLLEMLEIPGLGPKHVKLFWKELDITTLPKLKAALEKGVIAELPGFGEKSAQKLVDAINNFVSSDRIPRKKVLPIAKKIEKGIRKLSCVSDFLVAGSLRRGRKTVHDIDVLVSSKKPSDCAKKIAKLSFWGRMIGKGKTKVSGLVKGVQCDVRVVEPKSFGSASLYFTGSKGFNIYLRKIAIAKGLKLNEYGLFDEKDNMIAGKTEKDVFKALNIDYLKPEERESF